MSAFSSFLRDFLLPVCPDDGAHFLDGFKRRGTGDFSLEGWELVREIWSGGKVADDPVLKQADVVLGETFPPRRARGVAIEARDESHGEQPFHLFRRFRHHQQFLSFLRQFAGVSPPAGEGVQP